MEYRTLAANDLLALEAHMLRLDENSKIARFGYVVTDDVICRYYEKRSGHAMLGIGAFDAGGQLRGAAELFPLTDGTAEIAFSVELSFQGLGIGKALAMHVILEAKRSGLRTLEINYSEANKAMRRIARSLGARPGDEGMVICLETA